MRIFSFIALCSLVLLSCKNEPKLTDQQLMDKNVRSYFFMNDSVQVETTITDTIFVTELDEMIATVENNLTLIQLDIDTLQLMVDDWSYKALESQIAAGTPMGSSVAEEMNDKTYYTNQIKALEYRLKLKELEFKKASFEQSNRIFLRLRRSIWADIAGFEAKVHYIAGDEVNDIIVLMDANFNVVD